jgi:hypothetical protein
VTRDDLRRWIADYERAWRTAGTEPLGALFAPGASYSPGPYEPAHVGLDQIAALWEAEREGPDEPFAMDAAVVVVEGDTGVVRVEVHYDGPPAQDYRDLWIVTLAGDGRCTAFEEWPFWPEQPLAADGR